MATPAKGAKATKGKPRTPPILASITTEPVANSTTTKVPASSAKNIRWLDVSFLLEAFCKFLYLSFNLVPYFAHAFYRPALWVLYAPVNMVIQEQQRAVGPALSSFFFSFGKFFYFVVVFFFYFLPDNVNTISFLAVH